MTEIEARERAASWGLEFEVRICLEEGQSIEEAFKNWDIPLNEDGPYDKSLIPDELYEKLKDRLNSKYSKTYYRGKI